MFSPSNALIIGQGRPSRRGQRMMPPVMVGGGNAMILPIYRPGLVPMYGYGAVMMSPTGGIIPVGGPGVMPANAGIMPMGGPEGTAAAGTAEGPSYERGYKDALSDSKAAERLARYGGEPPEQRSKHDASRGKKTDKKKRLKDVPRRRSDKSRRVSRVTSRDDDSSFASDYAYETASDHREEHGRRRSSRMRAPEAAHASMGMPSRQAGVRAHAAAHSPRMPNIDEFVRYGAGDPPAGRFGGPRVQPHDLPRTRRMPMSPEMMPRENFGRGHSMMGRRDDSRAQGPRFRPSRMEGRGEGQW